jgi:hypothetical protein
MAAKILGMQQTLGNQAVQQRASTCPAFPSACPTGGACHTCPVRVQAKLAISQPGDVYEQEADGVAEQVMRMPENKVVSSQLSAVRKDGVNVHTSQTAEALSEVGYPIDATPDSGRPLPESVRTFFEPRLGYDFSGVRVHTDAKAAESAWAVNARAYTVGRNIVFGAGQYAPGVSEGQRLLAHELTHVVQQQGGSLGKSSYPSIQAMSPRLSREEKSPRPTSENVWGFLVTRSMCGCPPRIRSEIDWANQATGIYRSCDLSAFTTGTEVQNCFDTTAYGPGPPPPPVAETSPGGEITGPAPAVTACDRVINRGTMVHEIFHARQADRIARSLSPPFLREWSRLRGTPNRLDVLRPMFPIETAAFDAQWNEARSWVRGEVESFTWERRFYHDVLRAFGRIC